MRLGHETGHSPLPSVKVKNEHSYASTALFVCMASTRTTNSVTTNIFILPNNPVRSNCNICFNFSVFWDVTQEIGINVLEKSDATIISTGT